MQCLVQGSFSALMSTVKSTEYPMNQEAFRSGQRAQALFPALCEQEHCTSHPFGWFFPRPQTVSPHPCASEYSAENLSGSPAFSPSVQLSFSGALPTLPLWSPDSQLSAQPRESAGFYLVSLSLYHSLETLKTIILGNHRSHLICFHPLRDHCPSLSDVQCPENSCFTQDVRQRSFENSHSPNHTLENSVQISGGGVQASLTNAHPNVRRIYCDFITLVKVPWHIFN